MTSSKKAAPPAAPKSFAPPNFPWSRGFVLRLPDGYCARFDPDHGVIDVWIVGERPEGWERCAESRSSPTTGT